MPEKDPNIPWFRNKEDNHYYKQNSAPQDPVRKSMKMQKEMLKLQNKKQTEKKCFWLMQDCQEPGMLLHHFLTHFFL